jgi:hypothetical protein
VLAQAAPPRRCQRAADGCAARRHQAGEEGLLIEHVHEGVALGQRAVGKLLLAQQAHQAVHALEHLQPLLDVGRVSARGCGDHGRIELMPLRCRDGEQPAIVLAQALELALDHAADRFGHVLPDFWQLAGQRPAAGDLGDHLPLAQVAEQVGHE